MSNSPTPIQSFPGPEYFKVDSAAGSRTNNTNFSCPITNDGWVFPTPANKQCTSPQCKLPNDKYYFKSNFYVYGSMLYNDTQGTQEGVLVDNSPFYYTVDGQQPFKVANKDGRFKPGGGFIEKLGQDTDTNYTYKRLKLDACNVGTTSAVATGQCFYPLTEGISNYIEKKNLSTHMTASPPNMVGGLNPLSVPEECAGKGREREEGAYCHFGRHQRSRKSTEVRGLVQELGRLRSYARVESVTTPHALRPSGETRQLGQASAVLDAHISCCRDREAN